MLVLALASAAHADATLLSGHAGAPVDVAAESVDVALHGPVAETTVTTTFAALDDPTALYAFALPADATAYSLTVTVDGLETTATVEAGGDGTLPDEMPADDAGALAAWLGDNPVRAWLGPFERGAVVTTKLSYVELVPFEGGADRYTFPLAPSPGQGATVPRLDVFVRLEPEGPVDAWSADGLRTSADGDVLTASLSSEDVDREDVVVDWTVRRDDVGLSLYAYRPAENPWVPGETDGYFVLLVTPPLDATPSPKMFTYVVDRSGSMAGEKIAQARDAATAAVDGLHDDDRFDVVAFDDVADVLSRAPLGTSEAERDEAKDFIGDLTEGGGTNLDAALLAALGAPPPDDDTGADAPRGCEPARAFHPRTTRPDASLPQIVLFLTDGQASSGVTDPARILADVDAANTRDAALWSVAIGADADLGLLTALSERNRGQAVQLGTDDLAGQLDDLFHRIDDPVLLAPALALAGGDTHDVLPDALPDLFLGGRVVVVGRYATPGPLDATLTGTLDGETADFSASGDLPDVAEDDAFVGRIWASATVKHLLARIAAEGETPELVDAVTALGTAYGLDTPYTRFDFGGTTVGADTGGAYAVGMAEGCGCSSSGSTRSLPAALLLAVVARRRRR